MFSCRLCQEDFPSFKARYLLHAQFGSFPEALMNAFGKCRSEQSSSESRYDLVLSSDSPSLDGSAQLSLMMTNEVAIVTILSLPLTRAPVEQVHEDYVGDFVTLLQDLIVTLVDVTDHSFMFSCCLCQEDSRVSKRGMAFKLNSSHFLKP
ncbi:uncharacterized protein LOC144079022 [Stigmatopora argus]